MIAEEGSDDECEYDACECKDEFVNRRGLVLVESHISPSGIDKQYWRLTIVKGL